ncbi:MAG: AEC family transporter [Pseudomonadota bacterium]
MLSILNVVLPVFFIVGAGYGAVKWKLFPETGVAALMGFTQNFAVPCLLFLALYRLDFGTVFDPRLVFSFYFGAIFCFFLGLGVARKGFARRPGESVAIGFGALFSNSVLLGLPIMERAYGAEALAPNYALIAVHAPICYLIGITAMEISRADGRGAAETARVTVRAMFRNTISMACGAGFLMNWLDVPLPAPVEDAAEMVARAALPAALFGLGGVLSRYRIRSTLGEALMITFVSTIIHPGIAYSLTYHVFALDEGFVRSATIMAAMAPGVNAYVFASMYDRATGEVASTVIIATAVSVFTVAGWLWLLGGAAIG